MLTVLSEKETFARIRDKRLNFARFGDGEFQLALGRSISWQRKSKRLQKYLTGILAASHQNVLVGIPNIYDKKVFGMLPFVKQKFWGKFLNQQFTSLLNPSVTYGSSFVSRKDNAPWVSCEDMLSWKELWDGEVVISVVGRVGWGEDLITNVKKKIIITCPPTNAFDEFDSILGHIKRTWDAENAHIVVLHLGPTATVLANELAKLGIWAVDLGSWQLNFSRHCGKKK